MNKLLALCLFAYLSTSVLASPSDEMKAVYTKYTNDIKTNNMDALGKLMTPDFKNMGGGRTTNKADTLEEMGRALKPIQYEGLTFQIKRVTPRDKTFVVLVSMTGTMSRKSADGKVTKLKLIEQCEDIWVKSPTGWMIKSSQTISQQGFRDGKPIVRKS